MRYSWQLLVVMALALTALSFDNNSAAEQPATTAISTTTTTTSPPPTTTEPTPTTSTTNPPGGGGGPGRRAGPTGRGPGRRAAGPLEQVTSHRVVPGDNLWRIARDHLAKVRGRPATKLSDREIAANWLKVIAANRDRLRSGDPDLIYPGEQTVLPPVAAAPTEPAPVTRAQASHVVVAGDNLWTIAQDHLAEARSGADEPTRREVTAYWLRVVEANRDRLLSGDPDLIYPGEQIILPPVD